MTGRPGIDRVAVAAASIATGRAVVVIGTVNGVCEGALVGAAALADTAAVAFLVRHSSGFVQVATTQARASELGLPPMTVAWGRLRSEFSVSVDAATGVTTGISAQDRARTIRLLGQPDTVPTDFHRPGHVLPLCVADEPGAQISIEEAALRLAVAAGCTPVAYLASIVSEREPTRMAGHSELRQFAQQHDLAVLTTDELADRPATSTQRYEFSRSAS
jgi:3,4-dihydroxy 2-butanone 4-phosphate synthase/GTP cyclohydrolase II